MLGDLTMADLYEQLLDSIDTLTPEQLTELASIINKRGNTIKYKTTMCTLWKYKYKETWKSERQTKVYM